MNNNNYITIKCSQCEKTLLTYNPKAPGLYGTPIRHCKNCEKVYLDPRYREIAIEGIPSNQFSFLPRIICIILGAFILYRAIHLFQCYQLDMPSSMQWFMPTAYALLGGALIIDSLLKIFKLITGRTTKKFTQLMQESEQRLNDKNYVYTLQYLGYKIPTKYL